MGVSDIRYVMDLVADIGSAKTTVKKIK